MFYTESRRYRKSLFTAPRAIRPFNIHRDAPSVASCKLPPGLEEFALGDNRRVRVVMDERRDEIVIMKEFIAPGEVDNQMLITQQQIHLSL